MMEEQSKRRTPKRYDGIHSPSRLLKDILPSICQEISQKHQERPDLIVTAWAQIVGPRIASMTTATSYMNGVLHVKVSNSTLYSLLVRTEKLRLLQEVRRRFPKHAFRDIRFKMS